MDATRDSEIYMEILLNASLGIKTIALTRWNYYLALSRDYCC